jgi:hypothetical protein
LVLAVAATACAGDDDGDPSASTRDGGSSGEAGGLSGELSVLTYDVAGLPGEVALTAEPGVNIPLISPMLNGYDLVLTQDDYDWFVPSVQNLDVVEYHERLRAQTTHQFRSGPHPGPIEVGVDPVSRPQLQLGDGLGILSRFPFESRQPLDDVVRVAWPGCHQGFEAPEEGAGDCVVLRGFAATTIRLANGVNVDVYTLQTEVGETEEDQRLQAEDMDILASYIEQHSGDDAVVVGGATNLHTSEGHPDAEIWDRFVEATGLTDTCAALSCDQPELVDKVAFRSSDEVELTPMSHAVPRNLFVNPEGEDLSYRPPVAVQFEWQASGSG